jgi:hypothetical protein
MASLGETFVTKSYAKGKPVKKKSVTRVSASARGEGSRAKPVAKRVSPSIRKEGNKRVAPTKPSRIVESGVGNAPMTVVKTIDALLRRSALKDTLNRAMPLSTGKSVGKHSKPTRRTKTVTSNMSGEEIPRTKAIQKGTARFKKEQATVGKRLQKKGSTDSGISLTQPRVTVKGYKGLGPVASRQKKAPIKYGKR